MAIEGLRYFQSSSLSSLKFARADESGEQQLLKSLLIYPKILISLPLKTKTKPLNIRLWYG